jgi:hypothetical protein
MKEVKHSMMNLYLEKEQKDIEHQNDLLEASDLFASKTVQQPALLNNG